MQVYLPEALFAEIKARRLPASELLQAAVRAEVRRQDLLSATDHYLGELLEEVGRPQPEEVARAEAAAIRIAGRPVD